MTLHTHYENHVLGTQKLKKPSNTHFVDIELQQIHKEDRQPLQHTNSLNNMLIIDIIQKEYLKIINVLYLQIKFEYKNLLLKTLLM